MRLPGVRGLSGLLYAVFLSACGDSPARTTNDPQADAAVADADASDVDAADASADAGDMSTADAGPKPLVANCPVRGQDCGKDFITLDTILVASDYGAGAKFVTASGAAVLLQTPDAGARVLRVHPIAQDPEHWRVPDGYDVLWLSDAGDERGVYLLGTSQADGALALFYALGQDPPSALTPPPFVAAELRGLLARSVDSPPPQPCVYGKGLSCFDGFEWRELIPADVSVSAASFASTGGLAVAEDGTLWFAPYSAVRRPRLGDFSALDLKVPGVVRSLHGLNIVTDQGLYRLSPSTGELVACPDADAPLIVSSDRALYTDGRYLQHYAEQWCEVETLALSGPILGVTTPSSICGHGSNLLVLTEDKLRGIYGCWDY